MDQNTAYTYAYQPRQRSPSTASSRSGGAYQNSSAFSASANPDEDWTKISDLAERRRIQNRIAQRNYRKKLKRRLEDLERRTTSSSASPEQSHREIAKTPADDGNVSEQMRRRRSVPRAGAISQEQQWSSDILSLDNAWMNHASNVKPTGPFSLAPTYSFPESYPPTTDCFPDDIQSTAYARMPMTYTTSACSTECIQSISPPLPAMVGSENYKQSQQYPGVDVLTPFNLNYASLAGFSVPTTQGPTDFISRTPPLFAPSLYYESADGSPPQFTVPMTPDSRSTSPHVTFFEQLEV